MQLAVPMSTCVNGHMETKDLIKALRSRFKISQDSLARRCGLARVEITKLETGRNKATSFEIRASLARGFGLQTDDMSGYLSGKISLDEIVARANLTPDPSEDSQAQPSPPPYDSYNDLDNDLRREMFRLAVEDNSFAPIDVDVAVNVFRSTRQYVSGEIDLVQTARKLLESARDDRLNGGTGAAQSVLARKFYVMKRPISQNVSTTYLDEAAKEILKVELKEGKVKPKRRDR